MSKPIVLSGIVSHINYLSETSGTVDKGTGSISTSHSVMFRVDNIPYEFPGTPNLGEGDRVTIVFCENGIGAMILRNDSTGVTYYCQGWIPVLIIAGAGVVFLGLTQLFTSLFSTLLFTGIGIWMIFVAIQEMPKLKRAMLTQ
jgi:hypothetical protein